MRSDIRRLIIALALLSTFEASAGIPEWLSRQINKASVDYGLGDAIIATSLVRERQ